MKNHTEEIILLTLILCIRHRKNRNYCAARSKPHFWVRDIFTRRKQHGEFHQIVQELKLSDCEFYGGKFTSSSSAIISFIIMLYYYTINIFQKVNYKFLFFLIKDTLKAFDNFKNKQKTV